MRNRLQYTEEPSFYYQRLWKTPRASIKDLIRMYEETRILWEYRDFQNWFKRAYSFDISYKQWRAFERYYNNYKKRKRLKIPETMKVNKEFFL